MRAVPTSSSNSPRSSPVTGCTIGILSRRRLTTLPGRRPSRLVRSITIRLSSTYTTYPRSGGLGAGAGTGVGATDAVADAVARAGVTGEAVAAAPPRVLAAADLPASAV